jgi:hypothetical protein
VRARALTFFRRSTRKSSKPDMAAKVADWLADLADTLQLALPATQPEDE